MGLFIVFGLVATATPAVIAMEPSAFLAQQPVWQAGRPIPVSVDFEGVFFKKEMRTVSFFCMCMLVPRDGASAESKSMKRAFEIEHELADQISGRTAGGVSTIGFSHHVAHRRGRGS